MDLNIGTCAIAEKCRFYLDKDILPALAEMQVDEIGPHQTAALIAKMEEREAFEVASKTRQWLTRIFRYAQVKGLCVNNPAADLIEIAAKAPPVKHYPHLSESELPAFLKALETDTGSSVTKAAARLVILTAARPGIVRFAEWSEFDFESRTWQIPAEKMKMRRPHLIPLPTQALSALRALHEFTDAGQYLFPGQWLATPRDSCADARTGQYRPNILGQHHDG